MHRFHLFQAETLRNRNADKQKPRQRLFHGKSEAPRLTWTLKYWEPTLQKQRYSTHARLFRKTRIQNQKKTLVLWRLCGQDRGQRSSVVSALERAAAEPLTGRRLPPSRTHWCRAGRPDLPLDAGGGPHRGPEAVPGAVHGSGSQRRVSPCPSEKRQSFAPGESPVLQKHMASPQNLTCPQCNARTWGYGSPEGTPGLSESNKSSPLSVLGTQYLPVTPTHWPERHFLCNV